MMGERVVAVDLALCPTSAADKRQSTAALEEWLLGEIVDVVALKLITTKEERLDQSILASESRSVDVTREWDSSQYLKITFHLNSTRK